MGKAIMLENHRPTLPGTNEFHPIVADGAALRFQQARRNIEQ
jgi:hypothetical protein